MTPHTLLDELHATITTLTAERDQVINEHARVAQLNKFLKEEVRVLSGKLERCMGTPAEQLLFDLSQREGEITILRQRLATVETEREHTVKMCASLLATLRKMHVAIHDQLHIIHSTSKGVL